MAVVKMCEYGMLLTAGLIQRRIPSKKCSVGYQYLHVVNVVIHHVNGTCLYFSHYVTSILTSGKGPTK